MSDNIANMPETEKLAARMEELEDAMEVCLKDGDADEYAKLDHEYREIKEKYLILKAQKHD